MMAKTIYLDHSATTPLDPEVVEAMLPFYREDFANPSSLHAAGRRVRKAVEAARDQAAALIGAGPGEILFTSGASESNNLAIMGVATADDSHLNGGKHIITSTIEHPAVLGPCAYLEELGYRVTRVGVDRSGRVDPEEVAAAITDDTLLITIMMANNETGTLQPIREIGARARARGVTFHCDAVQAVAKVPVDVAELNVDLLSFTGHKFHGPKGTGALYQHQGVKIAPLVRGGHQERGLRGGTENAAGIVGFGKACAIAKRDLARNMEYLWNLRRRFLEITRKVDATRLNGHPEQTVPQTINLCCLYVDGLALQMNLSNRGICISVASACTSGSLEPSRVLKAMGMSDLAAFSSARFSLGKGNTEEEIDRAVAEAIDVIETLRLVTAPEDIGVCDENCPCLWEGVG
jgi:cysteine desulfurase